MTVAPVPTPLTVSSPGKGEGERSRLPYLALVLILLLAAGLRFYSISGQSVWLDEIFTLEASAGHGLEHERYTNAGLLVDPPDLLGVEAPYDAPWWRVPAGLARDDNHPPLYFLLMRWWRLVAGSSPAGIRALSALISLAGVWLIFDAVRISAGGRMPPALWAAASMTVAQPQIQFAQEARAYALLMVLGLGAVDALLRLEHFGTNRRRLIALAACTLGMMLAHYYAIAPAAALGLYVLLRLRGRARGEAVLALIAAAIVFLILWGPFAWHQRDNLSRNNWWSIDRLPHHLQRTWQSMMTFPFRCLTDPLLRSETTAAVMGLVLYLLPPALIWIRGRRELLIWWLWLMVPTCMVLAMDLSRTTRQLEFLRYTIAGMPGTYALLALLLMIPLQAPRRTASAWIAHLLPAAAVLTCLYSLPLAYSQTLTPKPDWRVLAAFVDRYTEPNDVAVFFGALDRDPGYTGSQFLALRYYSMKLPRTVIFISDRPDEAMMNRLRQTSGVLIVVPNDVPLPENLLPEFLPGPRNDIFGLPRVWRWTPPPPPSPSSMLSTSNAG